jgi:hypothetical protein
MMKIVADHTSACCIPRKMLDVATTHLYIHIGLRVEGLGSRVEG